MVSSTSKFPQPLFTKTIELYGDRIGSKGNLRFAGLAWIGAEKFLLMQGDVDGFSMPSTCYRFLRLLGLAERLKKPVILWNLPAVHGINTPRPASLAWTHAIQNVGIKLLKFPHPLLTVFDETYPCDEGITAISKQLPAVGDATVVVSRLTGVPNFHQHPLRIVEHSSDIPAHLIELLRSVATIPATELVAKRRAALHLLAKIPRQPSAQERPHV